MSTKHQLVQVAGAPHQAFPELWLPTHQVPTSFREASPQWIQQFAAFAFHQAFPATQGLAKQSCVWKELSRKFIYEAKIM
jgi:hypothetical protein